MDIDPVPGSMILISNKPTRSLVCHKSKKVIYDTTNTVINVAEVCGDMISCTFYKEVNYRFKFRGEQCYEELYVLAIYPQIQSQPPGANMTISGDYVKDSPCYTVSGGVHEEENTVSRWGK